VRPPNVFFMNLRLFIAGFKKLLLMDLALLSNRIPYGQADRGASHKGGNYPYVVRLLLMAYNVLF